MNKKSGLSMMLAAVCAAGLIGCSSQPAETPGTPGTSSPSADAGKAEAGGGEKLITVWGADDFLKGDESPLQQAVKEFNEKYKGQIRVEAKYMPWPELNTAVQAAVTSNDLPDIFRMPQKTDVRAVVANGWIQPLDGLVSDNWKKQFYADSFMEGVNVIDGKTYTWPLFGPQLNFILYYNKDVLKNAGLDPEKPPKTWDELREMAKTVTSKGKGDVYGIVFGAKTPAQPVRNVQGLAAGTIPEETKDFNYRTGTYSYDHPAIAESLKFLLALKQDGSILPAAYTINAMEAGVLFGEGKSAFLIEGRHRMWLIKRDTPDADFGMAPIPTQKAGQIPYEQYKIALPEGYLVSKTTKHPEAVGKFIEEAFASELFYKKFMQSGVALTPIEAMNKNKSLYPYPEYETFYKLHEQLARLGPDYGIRNPNTAEVITEMGSFGQPKIKPNFEEIVQQFISGAKPEKDIEATLKGYNDKMNQGLKEAVDKVKQKGVQVEPDDFKFPNWDYTKDYTAEDYSKLK